MKKTILQVILIYCMFVSYVYSDTISVSGVAVHGQKLEIYGENGDYGLKAVAAPLKREDFESGAPGQLLSTGGYWSHRPSNTASFSTTVRNDKSTRSARQEQIGDDGGTGQSWFYRNAIWTDSDEKGVVALWVRKDITFPTTDTGGWQQKDWLLIPSGTDYTSVDNAPYFFTAPQYYDNTGTFGDYSTNIRNDLFVGQPTVNGSRDYFTVSTKWQLIIIMWQRSSLDLTDGFIKRYLSDPNETLAIGVEEQAISTRTTGVDGNIKAISLGMFNTNSSNEAEVITYYDNIYMDNSWSLVIIGDNANFSLCTHWEVQTPSLWLGSGNQVNITVDQGSFPNGPAFVFVVNDGVPGIGFPITFAGAPPTTTGTIRAETVNANFR